MGLDTVELVLEVEDRFGIQIPDDEASCIRTVGELHELILRKLAIGDSPQCLTAVAFYRLRRAFVEAVGVDRHQFHPQRPLAELLPLRQRRRVWPILSEASHLRMPPLRRPAGIAKALAWAGVLVFLAGLVLPKTVSLWTFWGGGAATIALAMVLTHPLAVYPAGRCKTVGDLVQAVFDANSGDLLRSTGAGNRKEIWQSLVRTISEQLGVRVEDISPGSRFVEDLNCG